MKRAASPIWLITWAISLTALMLSGAENQVPGAPTLCSLLIRNPYLRSERETYLVGSARSDTVRVRISDVPGALDPSKRYPYIDSTPVFGQVVRVRSLYGAHADRLLAGIGAVDSTVVLIRYSLQPTCQTVPARVWLDTGFVYHFTALLRADSEWVGGRPTFDIPSVPPFAVYPPYLRHKRDDPSFDSTLTVDEYTSLVKVLPTNTDWSQHCSSGLARIAGWAQSHKPRSEFYPANDIMRVMQWNCPGSRRGQ